MRAALAPVAAVLLVAWVIGVALHWHLAITWTLLAVAVTLLAVRRVA